MCASRMVLLVLPAVAAAQMIVTQDVAALRGGGRQLVLRGDGARGGAPLLGGAGVAMLQGVGTSESAALRGGQAGVFLEHTEKMWMPAGGGAVQRQDVEEEDQVSSDGRRQVRQVTCMDGRCEGALASGPALASPLGSAAEAGKEFVDHLKAAAKKASRAPCDEDEARQFLEAVRDEYVHGVPQDVGRYIAKEGGPSRVTGRDEYVVNGAVQDKLDPFEERVRQARVTRGKAAASREVDAIAEEWGLWSPLAPAAPASVATRIGAPMAAKPVEVGDDAAERADYAAGRVRTKAWMEDDRSAEARAEDDDDDSDGADDDDGPEIVYDFVPDSAVDDDGPDGPDGTNS